MNIIKKLFCQHYYETDVKAEISEHYGGVDKIATCRYCGNEATVHVNLGVDYYSEGYVKKNFGNPERFRFSAEVKQ